MSIQDNKFEVYVCGYNRDADFINKKYIEATLEMHSFNLCESIEIADFILNLNEFSNTNDAIFSIDYAKVNCIEVAENLYDLLRLRDEAEFRGI